MSKPLAAMLQWIRHQRHSILTSIVCLCISNESMSQGELRNAKENQGESRRVKWKSRKVNESQGESMRGQEETRRVNEAEDGQGESSRVKRSQGKSRIVKESQGESRRVKESQEY